MIPNLPYTTNSFDTEDELLVRKADRVCLRKMECIWDSRARSCGPFAWGCTHDHKAVRTARKLAGQNKQGRRCVSGPLGYNEARANGLTWYHDPAQGVTVFVGQQAVWKTARVSCCDALNAVRVRGLPRAIPTVMGKTFVPDPSTNWSSFMVAAISSSLLWSFGVVSSVSFSSNTGLPCAESSAAAVAMMQCFSLYTCARRCRVLLPTSSC